MKIFLVSIPSLFVWLVTVTQVFACQQLVEISANTDSISTSQTVFRIAADTVPCTGLMPMSCLVVNNKLFYDSIDGYDHQEGIGRIIKIERTQICDPDVFNSCPQDIGIYRYHLLEIIK